MMALLWVHGTASAAVKLNVGLGYVAVAPVGLWVAQDEGFFAKEGLDVSVILLRGDTQTMQALLAGSLPIANVAFSAALAGAAAGHPIRVISSAGIANPYVLVTTPGIRSPEQLKGRAVGVLDVGLSSPTVALHFAFRHFGLDRRADGITILPIGTSVERLAAVASGRVAGTVVNLWQEPLARRQGLTVLADLTQLIPHEHNVYVTTARFREQNGDSLRAFVRALVAANAFILDPAHRTRVERILAARLKLENPEDIRAAYEEAVRVHAMRRPLPSQVWKDFQPILELVREEFPQFARVKPEAIIDDGLVDEVVR